MLNIDDVLKEAEEVQQFQVEVEGEFTVILKKPDSIKFQRMIQTLLIKHLSANNGNSELEIDPAVFLGEGYGDLMKIAESLCDLAIGWKGVTGDFAKEKLWKYFSLFPEKMLGFATGFIDQYQEWKEALIKNSIATTSGKTQDNPESVLSASKVNNSAGSIKTSEGSKASPVRHMATPEGSIL